MPVHATRSLPGSERITSNIPKLMASFDPAKPLTFEVCTKYDESCMQCIGFHEHVGYGNGWLLRWLTVGRS
jgi:hypothetical protein